MVTAGVEARLTTTLSAEATGFYRELYDLVHRAGPLPSPTIRQRRCVQDGIGRSYGAAAAGVRAAPGGAASRAG